MSSLLSQTMLNPENSNRFSRRLALAVFGTGLALAKVAVRSPAAAAPMRVAQRRRTLFAIIGRPNRADAPSRHPTQLPVRLARSRSATATSRSCGSHPGSRAAL